MQRHQLIRTELTAAIGSANAYATPGYTPKNLTELSIDLKLKMTRAELVKHGLTGAIPSDLHSR